MSLSHLVHLQFFFLIATLALIAFAVAEVAVIASPTILSISAFALCSFGIPPPIVLIQATSTSFHCVSTRVARVASLTGPVVLPVATLADNIVGDVNLTISTQPITIHIIQI
jgi:hypothetical protein